jgi:hypothetical protein
LKSKAPIEKNPLASIIYFFGYFREDMKNVEKSYKYALQAVDWLENKIENENKIKEKSINIAEIEYCLGVFYVEDILKTENINNKKNGFELLESSHNLLIIHFIIAI